MIINGAPDAERPADDVQEAIDRLANMDLIAYEQARAEEAKQLGFRAAMLDMFVRRRRRELGLDEDTQAKESLLPNVEPWPDPVNVGEALDEVVRLICRYVIVPPHAAETMALWAFHAHAVGAAYFTPRLAFLSPEKGSGKSTCLDVVGLLVNRPLPVANITSAALFRIMEAAQPTLLLDEADTFLRDSEDLRGALNAGHKRGTPIARVEGEEREVKLFQTFGPVALAGIGNCLPDTLYDRSLIIPMKRALLSEPVARLRMDRAHDLQNAAAKLARAAADHLDDLKAMDPQMPPELFNRAADNWRALLAIADLAGGHWPHTARAAASALSAAKDDQSVGVMLLDDMKSIFIERQAEWISTADFIEKLATMDERPWPEMNRGSIISPRQVAATLSPFAIKPRDKRSSTRVLKGYQKSDFQDAWTRYLPDAADNIRYAATTRRNPGVSANIYPLHTPTPVADGNAENVNENNTCSGVADDFPQSVADERDPFDLEAL